MKSKRPLNPCANFDFFVSGCHYGTYEEGIFAKLADNGLSGCRLVVGADRRKWGYLEAALWAGLQEFFPLEKNGAAAIMLMPVARP